MKKNIVVLADALRHDYINEFDTPFLNGLKGNSFYIEKIIPSLGFCERAEILTGKKGNKTGLFTAIEFNKKKSDYKNTIPLFFLNILYKLFDFFLKINRSYFLFRVKKKIIRVGLSLFYPNAKMSPYNIPPAMLNSLSLTEDYKDHSLPNAFSEESLVDICLKRNINLNFDAFTALGKKTKLINDEMRIKYVIEHVQKENNDDLYFLYIGVLDEKGHYFGPDSIDFKEALKNFDTDMKSLFSDLKNKLDCNILIVGDHGMSNVIETLDFQSIINGILKKNMIQKEDIQIFCDSTMGRLRTKNKDVCKRLKDELKNNQTLNENGYFLSKEDLEKLNIPHRPESYGDIIWIANNGVMINPDYFHGFFPPKGMHGYLPNQDNTYGTLLLYGSEIRNIKSEFAELTEVNSIIKTEMLGL
mgnify:CR=1 FL=1|tara:strand:- start:12177 stop:13421 length:1245 start_codon:yes stop_codon:yes gene_type:complete